VAEEERIERSVILPVSPDRLWDVLTRPEHVSDWFGATVLDLELRRGGRLTLRDESGRISRAVVQTVERPVRFSFRWLPEGRAQSLPSLGRRSATVEFLLRPVAGGTRLTVTESPLPEARDAPPRAEPWSGLTHVPLEGSRDPGSLPRMEVRA
jgi:uncharacterized protein YndB with AHSA1/START domain